jgi:hypothetical protein
MQQEPSMARIFLLSPANCTGVRARMVMRAGAGFELARRLRGPEGAPLGEVFSFVSGLYFRGKLAYARAYAAPPDAACPLTGEGALVITPGSGLRAPSAPVTLDTLRRFARVEVDPDEPRYRRPLEAACRAVAERVGPACEVVLLGSVASPKYVEVLGAIFGARLTFPAAFVGRGDMSRGGRLLRSVAGGHELEYLPLTGAVVHGPRPPRLPPLAAVSRQAPR